MSGTTPFSGSNALATVYGSLDGGTAGDHLVSIPNNFSKIVSEVQSLHTRVCVTENLTGASGNTASFRAECNGSFQVRRSIPAYFSALGAISGQFILESPASGVSAAYTAPAYTGGSVAATGSGTSSYVQSMCPGWMLRSTTFSDLGQPYEANADSTQGMRLTFDLADAFVNDAVANFGTGTGYNPAGGDLPAVYQCLHRHIPIEAIRGRSVTMKVTYEHAAAMPTGVQYRPYISYVDGGNRFDYGDAVFLSGGTTEPATVTVDTTSVGTDGVIPETATAVEVGIMLYGNTAGAGTDTLDLLSIHVGVGALTSTSPLPWALDAVTAASHYASFSGTHQFGERMLDEYSPHKVWLVGALGIATLGQITPATNLGATTYNTGLDLLGQPRLGVVAMSANCQVPLQLEYKRANDGAGTSLIPNCRTEDIIASDIQELVAGDYSSAHTNVQLNIDFLRAVTGTDPVDARGRATGLQFEVVQQPVTEASPCLRQGSLRQILVNVEVQSPLAPCLF